jgi:lipopolysaccharide biosynthesis protein
MSLRALAFYLPQFHPIPENDHAWGAGFTEWTNVRKARPLFPSHHQPRVPSELGYYDLRDPKARAAQAALAREYGIHGFCYYHYWFGGRRLLHEPIDAMLNDSASSLPFCLCWANENWTRNWDGRNSEIIVPQAYSPEDDLAHIRWLLPVFNDPRYIRVDGRPLFLVYRVEDLPAPEETARLWRTEARRAGRPEPYLVYVENFRSGSAHPANLTPDAVGFDASVAFAPNFRHLSRPASPALRMLTRLQRAGLLPGSAHRHNYFDYPELADRMSKLPAPPYKRFSSLVTGWDNSARRRSGASVFLRESPDVYENWLRTIAQTTRERFAKDERLLFINAWNEWAEGTHLEPCARCGRAYLEATRRALLS